MPKVVSIPEESFKELNRSMYNLYKYFSEISSKLSVEDSRPHTPTQELDFQTRPWLSYKFQSGNVSIGIRRFRTGYYSIECLGIVLTKPPFSDDFKKRSRSSDYRYNNCYGRFDKFESALSAFNEVVKQYINQDLGVFF